MTKKFYTTLILLFFVGLLQAQTQATKRSTWFTDSRFGMFIHWGIYSGAEGLWKGEKLRYENNYAEWIFYRNSIAKHEYVKLLDNFKWDNIDPEKWVLTAKKAGMKYIIFTAKHHDGFALWNSKASNYNISNYTKDKRDIVKELAAACRKHGIKLGLYYSHWIDWEHPSAWSHDKEIYTIDNQQYDLYWQEKVIPQVTELLSNYGNISLLWFDMWIHHDKTIVSHKQLMQLKQLIRKLQPDCLINSRLGLSLDEDSDIDFKTLNDNELGQKKEDFPWQSPATIAHSWGYSAYENDWKSSTSLLHNLINNVSLNGNMVLNIGPRADGSIEQESKDRLNTIGKWLETHGEAIYQAQAFDLDKNLNDWGKITCKKLKNGKTRLYLHVYNWPISGKLYFSGVSEQPQKAYILSSKAKTPIEFKHQGILSTIDLPAEAPNPYVSVIVLEYADYPESRCNFAAINNTGGYNLNLRNLQHPLSPSSIIKAGKFGSEPEHILIKSTQNLEWQIYVEKACHLSVDASYHYTGNKAGGNINVFSKENDIKQAMVPGRQTVGEPNMNWHVKKFESHCLGTLHFPDKGFYTIRLQMEPEKRKTLAFQWLWLFPEEQ